ncbi:GvpL/GvpF family gas vesicle protein [Streptomyces physcomitrii]|uniref:Gas vesicle protein n=1 Tax=Streptomyces physcomitrii TaxID=2724184 RepID=A0ABX1H2L8_9ACTN|nr:GvpL/GvpF family gas vesicle protein [Streptomyces physcomitrii]NKI42308.1 gas vesicle protein [Streptomyces physcomitrii]
MTRPAAASDGRLAAVPPEERLAVVSPEQHLANVSPEEHLATAPPGEELATYVFAVCRRRVREAAFAGLPGLAEGAPDRPEHPVRTLRFGALTAVVQHVPAARFTEEAWQQRLADIRELERCARAHHAVVTVAAAGGPAAPLALGTLYHGDDRARAALESDAERFHAALDRIDGHVEWGVKAYVAAGSSSATATAGTSTGGEAGAGASPRTGTGTDVSPRTGTGAGTGADARGGSRTGTRTGTGGGAGRAYLERKRGAHRDRAQRHERALRLGEEVDAELTGLARAGRRLRAHSQEFTGRERLQVLNATYLVAAEREAELRARVESLRHRTGARIEVSGPWVPYSFAGEV